MFDTEDLWGKSKGPFAVCLFGHFQLDWLGLSSALGRRSWDLPPATFLIPRLCDQKQRIVFPSHRFYFSIQFISLDMCWRRSILSTKVETDSYFIPANFRRFVRGRRLEAKEQGKTFL